jgi:prefoldin subunit 5
MGPESRLATLKSTLTVTQTELADLKTTVTELLVPKSELQVCFTADVAALKAEVEELTARIDSIETDAGQTASVIDSLSQAQTRLERSSQALLAWRAQVDAYILAHPAASQSQLDKVAAVFAACLSLVESVRDAQEKLSSTLQSNFTTAIKDLMQCMADGKKGAITRRVRCSMVHGGSASPETSGSTGSLALQGFEAFSTERTGGCLE